MVIADDHRIAIDEGTVNVELVDSVMSSPYEISYRPQGTCQPQVEIQPVGERLQVRHLKSCHGKGYKEGTIFTLKLSTHASYELQLKAGRITVSGTPGIDAFGEIDCQVSVGRITNARKGLDLAIHRKHLLGASVQHIGEGGNAKLSVNITYGELNIL